MSEKILKIRDLAKEFNDEDIVEGYEITTDKQVIRFLIDSFTRCSEEAGHYVSGGKSNNYPAFLVTEDSLGDFIGAELLSITRTDSALRTESVPLSDNEMNDEKETIFITIETSKGNFQLAVYNYHNGYYGHDVKFISEQLKIEEEI